MEKIMLKCKCMANMLREMPNGDRIPTCIHGTLEQIETPDLSKRKARCSYYSSCKQEVSSMGNLAFFEYKPHKDYDSYYCGCWGWD